MKKEIKKVAHITLNKDYGGVSAWLIKETYNGETGDPHAYKVAKREHFKRLQEIVEGYLKDGFEIEIKNF